MCGIEGARRQVPRAIRGARSTPNPTWRGTSSVTIVAARQWLPPTITGTRWLAAGA